MKCHSAQKLEDTTPHSPVFDAESSQCHRELEAAGAGASRIEKQHAVALLLPRLVTVTGNDRAEPRPARGEAELPHVVQHVEGHAPDLANLGGRQLPRPGAAIVVAADG